MTLFASNGNTLKYVKYIDIYYLSAIR